MLAQQSDSSIVVKVDTGLTAAKQDPNVAAIATHAAPF